MAVGELADRCPERLGRVDELAQILRTKVRVARTGALLAVSGGCVDLRLGYKLTFMPGVDVCRSALGEDTTDRHDRAPLARLFLVGAKKVDQPVADLLQPHRSRGADPGLAAPLQHRRPHNSLGYRPPPPEAATPPLPASGSASLHLRPARTAETTMHYYQPGPPAGGCSGDGTAFGGSDGEGAWYWKVSRQTIAHALLALLPVPCARSSPFARPRRWASPSFPPGSVPGLPAIPSKSVRWSPRPTSQPIKNVGPAEKTSG